MKRKAIYFIVIGIAVVMWFVNDYSAGTTTDEVLEQTHVTASWNALSAASFIFN